MIHINHITFSYPEHPTILENISISLEPASVHGIVGLNGCGKTTLFNVITGFYQANEGVVLLDNQPLKKTDIAYIDTESFFYPKLTAKEFLEVFPQTNDDFNQAKLVELLKLPLDEFIENYSTGMKKKLLILSQLKQDKILYIFDEPFNGLDIETNKLLVLIIELLVKKQKTILISSHIIEPLYSICTNIHHLKNNHFFKSYLPNEFNNIEDDVFGSYTSELKEQLKHLV